MSGNEGYFATSYRDFVVVVVGVFGDFSMKKMGLLCGEPYGEFMLLLTFLSVACSWAVSIR